MRRTIACGQPFEGFDIPAPVGPHQGVTMVGQQDRRGLVGVREGQAAISEVVAQRGIGRRGDEQDEGCRHHIMQESGNGDFVGPECQPPMRAVAFEDQNLVAFAAEQGSGHQRC